MAANAAKTKMINLAILKLHGLTSSAGQILTTSIDDAVFASPTTATGANKDDVILYCTRYEPTLKQAIGDIQPKFCRRFADLGDRIKITEDNSNLFTIADWTYMFDLPSDYLELIAQIDQAVKTKKYEAQILTAVGFAHVVKGTDEQAYYCKADVTGAAANKPITGASYDTYWALFNTDDDYGADWESGKAYKSSQNGHVLVTNDYSNSDGDSAYIEYLAYVQAGVGDIPTLYDQHFIEAFTTLLASEMAPWSADDDKRMKLRQEYEKLIKPQALGVQARPDYLEEVTSWLDARTK